MNMIIDTYQEYIFLIGKLKDVYKIDAYAEHRNIHSFTKDKKPLFKLFYGQYSETDEYSIVVSFHIDLIHAEAIQWFINIHSLHPLVKIHDSYVEDSAGETYLGEDALALREVYFAQEVLNQWLENHTNEEIKEFAQAPIVGRQKDLSKTYNSQIEINEAIMEFEKMKKPASDDEVH